MAHPFGGSGNQFRTINSFEKSYKHIVGNNIEFNSTTNENIVAYCGTAIDGVTKTIIFMGERTMHGNVCEKCWGYRKNCNKTRIGHCVEALDKYISGDIKDK